MSDGPTDEQIRVSDAVRRELDRRRRDDESDDDVLRRVLGDDDRDLLAGFGRWSDEHAERVRAARERAKERSKGRAKTDANRS